MKELKDEQGGDPLQLGSKWIETDRLFVKWNVEEMNNQTPYGWLKEFCAKNNLPFYGLHSFRHFTASALIPAGLDVTTVSSALGHLNQTTALNITVISSGMLGLVFPRLWTGVWVLGKALADKQSTRRKIRGKENSRTALLSCSGEV